MTITPLTVQKSADISIKLLDELKNLANAAERSLYYPEDYRPFHDAIAKAKATIAEVDHIPCGDERTDKTCGYCSRINRLPANYCGGCGRAMDGPKTTTTIIPRCFTTILDGSKQNYTANDQDKLPKLLLPFGGIAESYSDGTTRIFPILPESPEPTEPVVYQQVKFDLPESESPDSAFVFRVPEPPKVVPQRIEFN